MAATFIPKATTAENLLVEVVEHIAGLQTVLATNPDGVNVISNYTRNNLTGLWVVTISLPVSSAPNSVTGQPQLEATEVFL